MEEFAVGSVPTFAKAAVGKQCSVAGRQKAEGRRWKAEGRRQKPITSCQLLYKNFSFILLKLRAHNSRLTAQSSRLTAQITPSPRILGVLPLNMGRIYSNQLISCSLQLLARGAGHIAQGRLQPQ